MKISAFIPTILALAVASASAQETPVTIDVRCPGVDLGGGGSSVAAVTKVGQILAESYNKIHGPIDGDDSVLEVTTFLGTQKGNVKAAKTASWAGKWDCHLCPEDDDTFMRAWESAFVAQLLTTTKLDAKTCSIDMYAALTDKSIVASPNVDITINCKGAKLDNLSVSKGTFLAHAVEAAYNTVHGAADKDDSHLSNVYFRGYDKKTAANFLGDNLEYGQKYNYKCVWGRFCRRWVNTSPGMAGIFGCDTCPNDDEMLLSGASEVVGNSLKAWEAEVVVMLQGGPFKEFHDVSSCDIDLRPKALEALYDAEINTE